MRIIFVIREDYDLAGGRIRSYNFAKELSSKYVSTSLLNAELNLDDQLIFSRKNDFITT